MPDVPLLLVDGSNLLFRAWFGFPARIKSRDKTRDLTGVFGFFALMRVAVRDEIPAAPEIAVVFDGELGSAARRATDPAYKAHRPGSEAALAPIRALPDVKRGLDALKISWTEIEDAEADDVIATLVSRAPAGRDVLIMSGDRDMYQLATDRVLVLNTAMRPGHRLIGPKHIEARYGVPPSAWCCRAGLAGDPSDGIKGVPGVGPVTAARLLQGGLHLEDLPASGRLTGRTGQRVLDNMATAIRCRDLARMRTDVPVPYVSDGQPSPSLPAPADVITLLNLW
jgi:DNA polymerase I